jgi:hypothetical protein
MSMISYALSLVPRPITDDYLPFDKEKLYMLKGGNKETTPKREIVKKFFNSAKRNLIVYNVINRINIKTMLSPNNHSGHRELIAAGVFTDLLALHDGRYKSATRGSLKISIDPELGERVSETEPHEETKCNLRKHIFESMELNNLSIFTKKGLFAFTPLRCIRDYYGSGVAFYFAWLSFYTAWTWLAAIVGLIVFIYGLGTAIMTDTDSWTTKFALTFDNALTIPFTIFTSIWAIVFLECWKRQEASLKTLWGVENLSRSSTRRPEFVSTETRISRVTCKKERYIPKRLQFIRRAISSAVLLAGVFVVLVFEIAIIIFQAASYEWNFLVVGALSGGFSVFNIIILSPAYRYLAHKMNEFSNFKTDERFEKEFVVKEFILNFIIFYSPII